MPWWPRLPTAASSPLPPGRRPSARASPTWAALKAFIAAAPVVVKPGETQSGGQGGAGNGTAALSADQLKVCAQLAISPDDFAKQLAADAVAA